MTDCDDVAPGSTTTLMQCGTGYASRFKFAGEAARYDGFAQFKTKEVQLVMQTSAAICADERFTKGFTDGLKCHSVIRHR